MTLGDIIKRYRTANRMSQDAFAKRTTLSKAYISILERNFNPSTKKPPIPTLRAINLVAKAMEIEFETVFRQLDDDIRVSLETSIPKIENLGTNSDTEIDGKILKAISSLPADKKPGALDYLKYLAENPDKQDT